MQVDDGKLEFVSIGNIAGDALHALISKRKVHAPRDEPFGRCRKKMRGGRMGMPSYRFSFNRCLSPEIMHVAPDSTAASRIRLSAGSPRTTEILRLGCTTTEAAISLSISASVGTPSFSAVRWSLGY